jgi:hypothetical protein
MILPMLIMVSIQTEEATKGEPSFKSTRIVLSDSFFFLSQLQRSQRLKLGR